MNKICRPTSITLIASFVAFSLPLQGQTGALTCTSDDGGYHYCRANTQNRVALARQLPGAPCQQGYNWGFDYRGVWVDRGCRARFSYGADNSGDDTGTAVAASILGAIVLGAVVANATSDDNDNRAANQKDYYRDGYRMGQRDWDNNRAPFYMAYRNRFPPQYENSFASGYDAGYNNRRNATDGAYPGYGNPGYGNPGYRRRDPNWGNNSGQNDFSNVPPNDPNRGTINNPGNGVSGVAEKTIYCADDSGNGRHCSAITAGGVDMVRQRSGSPCIQNSTWGVDLSGIWVSHGCRADFVLHGVAAN
jgi:Protein of unknown function (DUF3011)